MLHLWKWSQDCRSWFSFLFNALSPVLWVFWCLALLKSVMCFYFIDCWQSSKSRVRLPQPLSFTCSIWFLRLYPLSLSQGLRPQTLPQAANLVFLYSKSTGLWTTWISSHIWALYLSKVYYVLIAFSIKILQCSFMNSYACLNTHVRQYLHGLFLVELVFVSTSQSCLAGKTELASGCQFSSGLLKKEFSLLSVNSTHMRFPVCFPELLECLLTFIKIFREKRG